MQKETLDLQRIVQIQTQLLKIIEDCSNGKITQEEAKMKSAPLHKELDGGQVKL